jgi:transposase-like protein
MSEDDRVHCPECGASATRNWIGSSYDQGYDTLVEVAHYRCPCGKEFRARFRFTFESVTIEEEDRIEQELE